MGKEEFKKAFGNRREMNIYEILEIALLYPGREIKFANVGRGKVLFIVTEFGKTVVHQMFNANRDLKPIRRILLDVIEKDR